MLTDKDFELLYEAMSHDSCFPPPRRAFDVLFGKAEMLEFKAKKAIVDHGMVDSDLWIVGRGVTRLAYYNDNHEVTYGFGAQGTVFCSPLGFINAEVANFHLIAVTDVVMFRLKKADFIQLISTDIEISNWFSGALLYQLLAAEARINIQNYPAVERVERFMKGKMKDYWEQVNPHMRFNLHQLPMRVLASYFGITRSHMAHIIKNMYDKEGENKE